jgi:hypothetical protein
VGAVAVAVDAIGADGVEAEAGPGGEVAVGLSGRLRWSMRSRPQVALFCVSSSDTVWFCSTYQTSGLAARALAWASLMLAS